MSRSGAAWLVKETVRTTDHRKEATGSDDSVINIAPVNGQGFQQKLRGIQFIQALGSAT